MPCERCREQGPFRPGPGADKIVQTLGYWESNLIRSALIVSNALPGRR